ncbi:MAG: alpha/beta hydrolase [Bacteroidota bacterium]
MKAYFISGLGADKKAFHKLKLPAGYEPVYLDWIPPLPDESMKGYAGRFSSTINESENFILIGLSFGGMMATEIATIKKPRKIILISSVAVSDELPWYFKLAGKIGIQKIVPPDFYKKVTLLNHFMGTKSKEDKVMVLTFVKQTDPEFIKWSINSILQWKQHERSENIIHIHGSNDRLLPLRYTHADHVIQNGRHLMVLNKAGEINKILEDVLPVTEN